MPFHAAFEGLKRFFSTHRKSVAVAAGILVLAAGAIWLALPSPNVIGEVPDPKTTVQKDAAFSFVFSQTMDRASAERAVSVSPKISGAFSWTGNRLTFDPATSLEKGVTFKVTIGRGARSRLFKPLAASFSQEFFVKDDPEVTVLVPPDGATVRPAQTLTVLFDRPLRALTGDLSVPAFLSFEPKAAGDYHWQGTSGFEFVPKTGWAPATTYAATFSSDVTFVDGTKLPAGTVWHFSTPNLSVQSPEAGAKLDPFGALRLTFNYAVPPYALQNALTLYEQTLPGIGQPGAASEPAPASKAGLIVTADEHDAKTLLIRKAGGFRLGDRYELHLPQGFTGGIGSNGLTDAFAASYAMDELGFRALGSCPGASGELSTSDAFLVGVNNPTDPATIGKYVTVSPKLTDLRVTNYGWYNRCEGQTWPQQLEVTGRWRASTTYTITVSSGLGDVYGQKLGKTMTYQVKTAPYAPRADLSGLSNFGMLAAGAPRVFQVRTLNMDEPIFASLCSVTAEAYMNQYAKDCKEIGQKSYDTKTTLNDYKVIDIDLDALAGRSLPPGLYALKVNIPHKENDQGPKDDIQTRFLALSDVALTVKRDNAGKTVVWANDMRTGDVIADLPVTVFATYPEQKKVGEGKTGADGVASFMTPEGNMGDVAAVATDGKRYGISMVSWSDGISPWNFNLDSTYPVAVDERQLGFLHTDRLIYRPDQLVYFKGELRHDVDAALTVPGDKEIEVVFTDPNGTKVGTQTLPISAYGTFNGSFQLDPSMPLGTYGFNVSLKGQAIAGTFDVRAYRRPDFKVTLTTPEKPPLSGETARIPLHVEYYYGTPLARARVDYVVTRRPAFFQPLQGEWYSFTESEDSYCYWYCRTQEEVENVKSGTAILDAEGNFILPVPISLSDYRSNATYAVNVTVTDVNQRQVSANASFDAQKADFNLGIRPDPTKDWNASEAAFDVVSVAADGTPSPGVQGTVQFFKRVWTSVRKTGTSGETLYDWSHVDTLKGSQGFATDLSGKAHVSFTPTEDGEYLAVARAVDAHGRTVSASVSRWVDRGYGASVRVSDDHVMKILQDKASYAPGDVASLVVQTPYVKTKALVTVERDHIRSTRVVDLGTTERVITIPVTDDMTPNVYVSVVAVQGGGGGVPDFRIGYADLQIDTTKKVLTMAVAADKTIYTPGEKVTLTLDTKRSDGAPASSEVSVAVVDERVIALLGQVDKNILGRFWFPRTLGVATGQSITKLVKKLFVETQGGGGKGGDGGATAVRGNFLDTAYWKADVVTDAQGKAQVSFTLPDNLTTWQILAIGTTKDTVVGSAETSLITRRDLMAEPLLPRILRTGDAARIGTTVTNLTGKSVTADVSLTLAGATTSDALTRKVTIPAHDRVPLSWNVRVPMLSENVDVTVKADGGGLSDGFTTKVPVLGYAVPETVQASNLFGRSASEKIVVPDGILPDSGQLKVRVASSVGSGLSDAVEYLMHYEYGCSEQATSALIGALTYERLIKAKLIDRNQGSADRAHFKATWAIKDLSTAQKPDGGWAFWTDGDTEYPFLTAYIYRGLSMAEQDGYAVDENVMERAGTYLKNYLAAPLDSDKPGLTINERAQVLQALADHDPAGLSGYAQSLYEHRQELTIESRSFLAMALATIDGDFSRAGTIVGELKPQLVYVDPSTAYMSADTGYDDYFMGSDVRATSLYLMALERITPKDDDADRLMRYLMGKKVDGYWYDTQATASALSGLLAYVERHPIDTTPLDVRVSIDHALASTLKFDQGDLSSERSLHMPLADLKGGPEHLVEIQKDSEKRYFYDLSMSYQREIAKIAPFDNGFTVLADIYALDDAKHERPLKEAVQGDTLRVHVKLLVPKEHRYVSLEYHLPAGLEAIDTGLHTSPQYLAGQLQNCAPDWSGEQRCLTDWEMGWWWENVWRHVEQRDDRVFLFSDLLTPGVYEYDFLASAVTPGTFAVPPTRAYEFYKPQANGHDEGKVFTVKAK